MFPRLVYSKRFLHVGIHVSDDYFATTPPETLISLRHSLCVSLRVCIVVFSPEV